MKISIKFAGKIEDKEWPHFLWFLTIGDEVFQYKTGLGHFTSRRDKFGSVKWNTKKPNIPTINSDELGGWIHVPSLDEVVRCLFNDSETAEMSFDSFCDDFGYSNDSLKALDIYRACAENAKKLKKAYGKEYYAESKRYLAMEI